ncbi:hypothetical protein NDU88_002203 [Pleurodeles waltl]|uniref:Uncharacterized protein n=1 Tax=Pleurodeles waltl TaxID=8319 RepID=A0AAV7Q889_PLEWA|nr:hypothetical protein NDU88_002203 [Pleurodeles waltl]
MSRNKKFFETWKSVFPVLRVSMMTLILFVVEELMEVEFTCPADQEWMRYYSLAFFLFPASFWFLLSLLFQQNSFFMCRCKGGLHRSLCLSVLGKAGLPSVLWAIILLFDGRYLDCFANSYKKDAYNIVVGGQSATEAYLLSQIQDGGRTRMTPRPGRRSGSGGHDLHLDSETALILGKDPLLMADLSPVADGGNKAQ